MDQLITDFNTTGLVMSGKELENERKKRGECVTCGRKCFQKKLLRMVPINDPGRVLDGRCLNCKPLDATTDVVDVLPAAIRPATREDLTRFAKSQSNLNLGAGGSLSDSFRVSSSSRRTSHSSSGSRRRPAASSRSVRSLGSQSIAEETIRSAPTQIHSSASGRSGTTSLPSPLNEALTRISNQGEPSIRSNGVVSSDPSSRSTSNHSDDGVVGDGSTLRLAPPSSPPGLDETAQYDQANRAPSDSPLPRESISDSEAAAGAGRGRHARDGSDRARHPSSDRSSYDEYDTYSDRSTASSYRGDHPHRNRSQQREMQEAHPRMHHGPDDIDEQDAYELAASHPAGAALMDYYNRFHQETSSRSLDSNGSHQHSVDASFHRGHLNRGGQVPYPASVSGNSQSSDGSSQAGHQLSGSGRFAQGQRSDDDRSIDRFVGEDLLLPQRRSAPASASPIVADPRLGAHLARLAAEEIDSNRYSSTPDDNLNASQHTSRSLQSQHSHRSRSSRNTTPSRRYPTRSSLGDPHMAESHATLTLAGSTGSPYDHHRSNGSFGSSSARDNAGIDRIRTAGTDFPEIVNVMLDFPDSLPVQSTGMQELSNLQLTRADADTFMHLGAHQVVINGMKSFPRDVELQISGCRAMWNASGTSLNQILFVESGAVDVILYAMNRYLDDGDVQEQAMATLANLAAVEANAQVMMERGVVSTIVECMNKHVDNAHVQAKGCSVITNMASHSTPLKRRIVELGGGGAVVVAMVMHPKDPQLQEKALRALRNLSANCDENKIELAAIGGIDSVISAMQVHRDEAGVQESGAWTLSNFAGPVENKTMIGEFGGIDVTVRAMWVHSDNIRVQEWCCRALFTLSLDQQNAALIQEVGGISAVVNSMQAHGDTAVIQEMGCAVLCNLAGEPASKMRIVDEEALDVIVLAMVLHSEDAKIQERGCQVLLQLSIVENCKAMQASNVGELALAAAERFPGQCGELANHILHLLDGFVAEYNNVGT